MLKYVHTCRIIALSISDLKVVYNWYTLYTAITLFQLTPEEFVAAGEHLVHHCPSWQWAAGDSSLRRDYLPADKQFLVTKNVPCYKRCGDMMSECNKAVEKVIEAGEGGDGEEGWVDTHHSVEGAEGGTGDAAEKVKEMKLDDEEDDNKDNDAKGDNDSDQEAVDMDDFIDSGMLEAEEGDAAAVVQGCGTGFQNEGNEGGPLLRMYYTQYLF